LVVPALRKVKATAWTSKRVVAYDRRAALQEAKQGEARCLTPTSIVEPF
jgi:hypothetical protein